MSNQLYDKGRQAFLDGQINWTSDDIRAILIDYAAYTPNLTVHQFLSDIPAGARIAVSASLANKNSAPLNGGVPTPGVADADDTQFIAVTGPQCEALVLYKHTGSDATARLISVIDTATNLPVTPNGGDILVAWDSGPNKIFKL